MTKETEKGTGSLSNHSIANGIKTGFKVFPLEITA